MLAHRPTLCGLNRLTPEELLAVVVYFHLVEGQLKKGLRMCIDGSQRMCHVHLRACPLSHRVIGSFSVAH